MFSAMQTPWLAFTVLWLTQVMTPGPNFVRISHIALAVSRGRAMITASGTAVGNSCWCLAAVAGVATLSKTPAVAAVLHLVGALYFGWLGIRLLRGVWSRQSTVVEMGAAELSAPRAFRRGLATALANPQSILFFGTILVATFPVLSPSRVAGVLTIVVAVTIAWYAMVTTLLTGERAGQAYERARPVIDSLFGAVLLASALRLVLWT